MISAIIFRLIIGPYELRVTVNASYEEPRD